MATLHGTTACYKARPPSVPGRKFAHVYSYFRLCCCVQASLFHAAQGLKAGLMGKQPTATAAEGCTCMKLEEMPHMHTKDAMLAMTVEDALLVILSRQWEM